MAHDDAVPNLHDMPEELPEPEESPKHEDVPEGPEVPPLNIIAKGTVGEDEQKEAVFRRIRLHEQEMLDLELDLWESTVAETVSQELIEELQAKQKLIHAYIVMYQNTFGGS